MEQVLIDQMSGTDYSEEIFKPNIGLATISKRLYSSSMSEHWAAAEDGSSHFVVNGSV